MKLKTTDFKRNPSGRTRIYEYTPPPPPINALVTPLDISLATAGLVPSSSGLASPLSVVLPSVSSTPNALPTLVVTSFGPTSWSASVLLASPSLASRTWLPVPYLPQNPWPTSSVVPTTASPSINGGVMANFTFPPSSSSSNFQPQFCSLPVSSGVAHPAPSLNPILQQASTSPDPILQEAISQAPRHRLPFKHKLCCKLTLRHILMLSLRFTPVVKSLHLLQGVLLARFCLLVHRRRFNKFQIIRQLQVWLHQVCFWLWLQRSLLLLLLALGFCRSLVRR